ncbi:MAG: motility associated factor glycosyltransferase family protein, partial [Sulfurimonas sp.]|nr:motility associated factor glycosyltransferase family protein [Sulfurimonas sp.]
MQNIESIVIQNYEKSMLYFKNKHLSLFNKLKALEILLDEGKYPQKYDLEYKDGYFDIVDLGSGNMLYNRDSYEYSHKLVDDINFKKDEHVVETFYNHIFSQESVQNAKKLTANHTHVTTAPMINYYNKYIDKSMSMKKIQKFMFLGVGLGLHIEDMVKKTDADVFLILEDDIELFRLSLFTCNYEEAFKGREAFFSVAQNGTEFQDSFALFYGYAFIRNHYLKFSLFSSKDEIHIKNIQTAILNRSEHCYSHAALLEKDARVLEKINQDYKFLSMLKKDEKFFDDKPILILGAGPSLGANKEWIKQHQNKFIIIAPFATLRVLYHLNIAPDIIVHIDEADMFANLDIKLYEGKEDFFKNSSFVFNASVPQLFFDTFDKDSIYLLEDRTKYKLNYNYIEVASVGEAIYAIALSLSHKDIYMLGLDMALGDDGSSHSKTHSTKNKVDASQTQKIDDVADLRKTALRVRGNFRDTVVTVPLFTMSIRLMNLQTKKYRSKDQNIYNLSDGAYFEDTTPLRVDTVEFVDKEKQEYGAVLSEYGITFIGYYKKADSENIYDINVYLDGECIESLRSDKKLKKVEEFFDVNSNGFEFVLEEKYFDKSHLLEFKERKSGKPLMDGCVNTISKDDKKLNEHIFLDSLDHFDKEKVKDLEGKDAIGFMAVEENLQDKDFVDYIKKLSKKLPQVTFKAFYFNEEQKELTQSVFSAEIDIFECVLARDIYGIADIIEVYILNDKYYYDKKIFNLLKRYFFVVAIDHNIDALTPLTRQTLRLAKR